MKMSGMTGKVITCKAAVAWEPRKPLTIETIEVAPPKKGEVRIRIIASGVCRSDAFYLSGKSPTSLFPAILGHEGAGIVESIGEGVTTVKPGDHVIPMYVPQCKNCDVCFKEGANACIKQTLTTGPLSDGTCRFKCKGVDVNHMLSCSTFTEYTVVEEISVSKISKEAKFDKVCLLGCGVSTGYGAALNTAKVKKGSTCAVFGLGAIGLAVVMGCKAAGASRIIGIDLKNDKQEIGKKMGLTEFINPNDYPGKTIEDVIIQLTGGGVDYTFECIGTVSTAQAAIKSSRKEWGISVLLGLVGENIPINSFDLILGRTWKSSIFGGWKGRDDLPKLVDDHLKNKIILDDYISHYMSLDEINNAFDLMKEGKSIRSILQIGKP